ncbi:MAG: amidase [Acidimicrobiales bacterium]
MGTWILRMVDDSAGRGRRAGLRIGIKDLIDVAGTITTAGSRAVASSATPARSDAACLAGIRASEAAGEARIVGKTNLHELAYGVSGINPWFPTPVNPLDPERVPGGSSSGSAVAVATGEADLALGTDTGGSIRIPAACCGVVGLKTTWGRIPLDGVRPLAPSLDTVGPMAADVAGVIAGMRLLEPGFAPARSPATRIGRLRVPATGPIDAAIDRALAASGLHVSDVELPGWMLATSAGATILTVEAWETNGGLVATGLLGDDVAARLLGAAEVTDEERADAEALRRSWRRELEEVFENVELLAMPVLGGEPPLLEDADRLKDIRHVVPANLAGTPAIAMPVPAARAHPSARRLPASLQLIGFAGSEELIVATAAVIEQAAASLGPAGAARARAAEAARARPPG